VKVDRFDIVDGNGHKLLCTVLPEEPKMRIKVAAELIKAVVNQQSLNLNDNVVQEKDNALKEKDMLYY